MSKDYQLRYHFDLTLAEYNQMLLAQDHKCAICGKSDGTDKHSGSRTKQLSVDHDHQTGIIRGLLCNDCNRALGQFKDDPEIVRKALAYLDAHEVRHVDSADKATEFLDELMKL